jgi:hypothetical protein
MDIRRIAPSVKVSQYGKLFQSLGSIDLPATSGTEILNAGLPSGDYYIKPTSYSGDAKLLYVDNDNLDGGWILVAKGRESNDANGWWSNTSYNEDGLVDSTKSTTSVSRVDSGFVNAIFGGWSANSKFLVNRIEANDSWRYLLPSGRIFSWTDFGGALNNATAPVNAVSGSRWSSPWWTGSELSKTNFNYWDWYATGNNDVTRMFSWWWSGHGDFRGWSAGSSWTTGFQNGTEGHAIQTVQVYVK